MSNSFTDFFETLLPREITLYVIPGSLVLSIIAWEKSFRLNEFFLENIGLKLPKSELLNHPELIEHISVIDYIFFGIIWVAAAYLVGLIVGGIKQGLHEKVERLEKHMFNLINIKIKPRSKVRRRDEFVKVSIQEKYEESGSKPLYTRENVSMFIQSLDDEQIEKSILPLSFEHLSQKDRLGMYAMYLAIHEEKMYRREIERYGIFKEALENITISLMIVGIVGVTCGKESMRLIYGLIPIIAIVFLLPGAQGYKELQKFRIETMFNASKEKQ